MNDFNLGQVKVRMKKIAVEINFYFFMNALIYSELLGAWN